jgi:hypothetical protein
MTAPILTSVAALAIALGLALPQAPWSRAGDSAGFGRWLADLQMRHGPWVHWPARLGLLSLYSTPGFRLVWAALGFVALVATADSLLEWRAQRASQAFPWSALAHAGLILLLAGGLVEEQWGWEQERLLVDGGRPVAAGPVTDALFLERVASGSAEAEGVTVRWLQGSSQGQLSLQAGQPFFLGPRTLHLQHVGMAVSLRLVDAADRVIPLDDPSLGGQLQPEVTLHFQQANESRYVSVPARDWVIRVAHQPAAASSSPFTLWIYRGLEATPLLQASLAGGSELRVGELRLRSRLSPYAQLRVALRPGLPLWLGGWLLLSLGLGLSLTADRQGLASPFRAWAPATLGLGAAIWLAATRPPPAGQGAGPLATASLLLLACATAALLLGASAGLRTWLARESPVLAAWPGAISWGLLGWTVGGGLAILAGWVAGGTLWHWTPAQARWALPWCLLAGAWHVRHSLRHHWALLAGLGLAATLAAYALLARAII